MSYQDDPNFNRRRNGLGNDRNYTGWIVGGVIAIAVILGIFAMTGRSDRTNTTANNANRPAATAPVTTGSAVPAPSSGQGAGENRQNPSAPAIPPR